VLYVQILWRLGGISADWEGTLTLTWLYLKLFRSTIESTTKGGRIYNVEGAAGVGVINVVIFFAPLILHPVMPSFSANIWS
jgi:hypothetical protein